MNYDDSDRLKPCPFCGSDAEFGSIGDGPDVGGHFVQCLNPVCSASSDLIYPLVNDVKNLLLERWNHRAMIAASPPAPAVPAVQAAEKLKAQIERLTREPDCRTCQHRLNCINTYPEAQDCTNADRYEPLPPVRLYRRTT